MMFQVYAKIGRSCGEKTVKLDRDVCNLPDGSIQITETKTTLIPSKDDRQKIERWSKYLRRQVDSYCLKVGNNRYTSEEGAMHLQRMFEAIEKQAQRLKYGSLNIVLEIRSTTAKQNKEISEAYEKWLKDLLIDAKAGIIELDMVKKQISHWMPIATWDEDRLVDLLAVACNWNGTPAEMLVPRMKQVLDA